MQCLFSLNVHGTNPEDGTIISYPVAAGEHRALGRGENLNPIKSTPAYSQFSSQPICLDLKFTSVPPSFCQC